MSNIVSIKSELRKEKNNEYDAKLFIENNTENDIVNWTITAKLNNNSTITSCKDFTISKIDENSVLLKPEKSLLKGGRTIKEKFEGTGKMPTEFIFNTKTPTPPNPNPTPPSNIPKSPLPPSIPNNADIVYNIVMNKLNNIEDLSKLGVKYQYSYTEQDGYSETNPNPKYFTLTKDNGLQITIYNGDQPFQKGSGTEPRSELRFLAKIEDEKHYIYQWDEYLNNLPEFDYCYSQVFGTDGPAYILRWRKGEYQMLQVQGDKTFVSFTDTSIKPENNVGKWVNWKIDFFCSKKNGFFKVYRDNVLMCELNNTNNSIGNNAYLKLGVYSSMMKPSNDVIVFKDNILCYSI